MGIFHEHFLMELTYLNLLVLREYSHVLDFDVQNRSLTAKLQKQGYRYHKLRKAFSKFYRRHFKLVSKYNVGLKTLLLQGIAEPEYYDHLKNNWSNCNNQRTNGPVNADLNLLHIPINMFEYYGI